MLAMNRMPIRNVTQSTKKTANVASSARIGVLKIELTSVESPHHTALIGSVMIQSLMPQVIAVPAGASPRATQTTQMTACIVSVIADTVVHRPSHLPTMYDARRVRSVQ